MLLNIFFTLWIPLSHGSCTAPDGSPMETGDERTLFFTDHQPVGGVCESDIRLCEPNGTLSGNKKARFVDCVSDQVCEHPYDDLTKLQGGETVEAYRTPQPPCEKETRVCDGKTGVLSGSFMNDSCKAIPEEGS